MTTFSDDWWGAVIFLSIPVVISIVAFLLSPKEKEKEGL